MFCKSASLACVCILLATCTSAVGQNASTSLRGIAEDIPEVVAEDSELLFNIRMLEIDRGRMRRLGIDFATADTNNGKPTPLAFADLSTLPPGLVEALRQNNVARELASAYVVVKANGKEVNYFEGGEVPVLIGNGNTKMERVGTEVRVSAQKTGQTDVAYDISCRLSERDNSRTLRHGTTANPGFNIRQCQFGYRTTLGKTVVLSGLVQRPKNQGRTTNRTELLVLVTCNDFQGQSQVRDSTEQSGKLSINNRP